MELGCQRLVAVRWGWNSTELPSGVGQLGLRPASISISSTVAACALRARATAYLDSEMLTTSVRLVNWLPPVNTPRQSPATNIVFVAVIVVYGAR